MLFRSWRTSWSVESMSLRRRSTSRPPAGVGTDRPAGTVLAQDAAYFDAQLSLGMAYYRKGDYPTAIAEGHKAEKLQPKDQLVHTNLSLFYMKAGDKKTAEHHGLQARIASWRENMTAPAEAPAGDPELQLAKPKPPPPAKFPDMPWKKKK